MAGADLRSVGEGSDGQEFKLALVKRILIFRRATRLRETRTSVPAKIDISTTTAR
jgi:hypothetical protein